MNAPPSASATAPEALAHTGHADCPHCAVSTGRSGSAKVAWAIALIAVLLLVAVFVTGVGTTKGTTIAAAGIPLLAVLVCPIVMGGMMWMMMRKGH